MERRTTVSALLAIGLLAMTIGVPGAGAETETTVEPDLPGEEASTQCPQVYLFVLQVTYVTVDASDPCVSLIVHDEQLCQDLADATTLAEHEGECEMEIDTSLLECPGPLCPGYPIEPGASPQGPPPMICVYPWGC